VLYVVGRSIDQGRRAGLVSVLGIGTGTLVLITLATAGLSSLVLASRPAFETVRWVGAAYLVYLGVRRLLAREDVAAGGETDAQTLRRLYTQGVVVNVLNPKTIVFIFAFLPQFVDVTRGHVWLQVLVLGTSFAALGTTTDALYALAAGTAADRLRGTPRIARFQRFAGGSILIALGVVAAVWSPSRSR
jgi:threonine/homoserine/homoserine lactone efflux protein